MEKNMFDNLLSSSFKKLYNDAIDSLVSSNGLGVPCTLIYESLKQDICNNCNFDPIQNRSSNTYNGSGPAPFPEFGICPICNGNGIIDMSSNEVIDMALVFDSKYWLNWNSKSVNIADNMAQSICQIKYLPKIQNAQEIVLDNTIENYGNRRYSRANEPEVCGLGSNRYIITMWQKIL